MNIKELRNHLGELVAAGHGDELVEPLYVPGGAYTGYGIASSLLLGTPINGELYT